MCTFQQQQSHGWIFPSLLFYLFPVPPLLSVLLSLLLCIIPFPTSLDSLWSLRWHPAKHSFPPAMTAHTSLPLGTQAPLLRDRVLRINPIIISYSVTPGHPKVAQLLLCRSTFWGEGEWSWDNTPRALPIRQSIIHRLLVCMYVHLIYHKACFI